VNKYIKYGLLIAVIALLGYKSVYFEKLSTRKVVSENTFDAAAFIKKLWEEQMPAKADSAIALSVLMDAVTKSKADAFNKYTNSLAIGNYRYALIKFDAVVADIKEDELLLNIQIGHSVLQARLAMEFIYGNAIRDASGLVQVKDYPNSSDLNSISEALNKIVRNTVLPTFKTTVKKGDIINGVAAVELNAAHIHWQDLELLPIRISIKP
jgi:predicted lipoprotein